MILYGSVMGKIFFSDKIPVTMTKKLAFLLVTSTYGILDWWFVFTLMFDIDYYMLFGLLPKFLVCGGNQH